MIGIENGSVTENHHVHNGNSQLKKRIVFFDVHVNQFLYGCRSTVEILLSLPWPFWGLNMNFRDVMFILFLLFVLAAPMFILLSKSLAQSPPNSWPESENHLKYKPSSARVSESHSCPHNFRDTPRSSAAQRLIGDGHFGFLRCFDDVNGGIRDLLRKCWAKKFQKQKQPGWKAMRDVGHGQSFPLKKAPLVEVCWIRLHRFGGEGVLIGGKQHETATLNAQSHLLI